MNRCSSELELLQSEMIEWCETCARLVEYINKICVLGNKEEENNKMPS